MWAIFLAIKHFRYFLEGLYFVIETDHSALVFVLRSNNSEYSGRRLRQLRFISELTSNIRHIEGKQNVVADCFSQLPDINAVFIDFQKVDLRLLALQYSPKSDHGFSSVELTFGTSLRLPGKFFESPKPVCETTYVEELYSLTSSLRVPPTNYRTQRDTLC